MCKFLNNSQTTSTKRLNRSFCHQLNNRSLLFTSTSNFICHVITFERFWFIQHGDYPQLICAISATQLDIEWYLSFMTSSRFYWITTYELIFFWWYSVNTKFTNLLHREGSGQITFIVRKIETKTELDFKMELMKDEWLINIFYLGWVHLLKNFKQKILSHEYTIQAFHNFIQKLRFCVHKQ